MYQDNDFGDKTLQMKKAMQLDFDTNKTKQKFNNMLQLASPDMEKHISHNGMVGTTPTPTQFIYPKYVTDEQEAYARGFVEALAELHQTPGMPNTGAPTSVNNNNHHQGPSAMQTARTQMPSSTYSTLMPMTSQPAFSAGYHMSQTTNSMSNNMMGVSSVSRRHPPFAPSGLVGQPMSHLPQQQTMQQAIGSSAYGSLNIKAEPATSSSFSADHQVPHSPSAASSRLSDSPGPDSDVDNDDIDHVENVNRLDSIPVDLEEQEKIKLERKRARNRIAARKCRTRKLERIGRLEEKVADLKTRNNELQQSAHALNNEVVILKQKIMEHINSGCQIMMPEMRMQGY